MTHFGATDAEAGLEAAREAVRRAGERSRAGDREDFLRASSSDLDALGEDVATRARQAAPIELQWLGLERYWRKRAEAGSTAQAS